jgi:hypothetical protein
MIKAIRISKKLNYRVIIKIYDILEIILYNKMNSRTYIYEYRLGLSKLIKLEKNIIIRNILDIDIKRFAPRLVNIKDITGFINKSRISISRALLPSFLSYYFNTRFLS